MQAIVRAFSQSVRSVKHAVPCPHRSDLSSAYICLLVTNCQSGEGLRAGDCKVRLAPA